MSSFAISVMKRMWVRSREVKVEDRDGETQKAILGGEAGERGPAEGQTQGNESPGKHGRHLQDDNLRNYSCLHSLVQLPSTEHGIMLRR